MVIKLSGLALNYNVGHVNDVYPRLMPMEGMVLRFFIHPSIQKLLTKM